MEKSSGIVKFISALPMGRPTRSPQCDERRKSGRPDNGKNVTIHSPCHGRLGRAKPSPRRHRIPISMIPTAQKSNGSNCERHREVRPRIRDQHSSPRARCTEVRAHRIGSNVLDDSEDVCRSVTFSSKPPPGSQKRNTTLPPFVTLRRLNQTVAFRSMRKAFALAETGRLTAPRMSAIR